VQGYDVHVAVEGTLQLLAGEAVTQETNGNSSSSR